MMQKMSHEKALEHIDALMGKVSIEKEAAPLEDAEKNGVIPGTPAGTETIPVKKEVNPDDKKEVKNPSEGEFASEKHQDLKDSTDGDEVEDMTPNANGNPNPVATDFNAGPIDKKSGEEIMDENIRLQALGQEINSRLDKQAAEMELDGFEKLSAEEQEALLIFKEAADMHYADYLASYAAGMQKKAEDVQTVMDAKGVDEPTAEATLNDIAANNPELVIPADEEGEAPAEEGGDLSGDDEALLEELANELEAAGVTPDELAAAVAELSEEKGAPEEVEKTASDRKHLLKAVLKDFMVA